MDEVIGLRHADAIREATKRYWSLLGAGGEFEFVRDTVDSVRRRLEFRSASGPPVLLSLVAPDFSIETRPTGGEGAHARIRWVSGRERFQIELPAAPSASASGGDAITDSDERLQRAGYRRFLYAHEFAHRFFYIVSDRGAVRALEQIVRDTEGPSRVVVFKSLHRIEERACNRIASQLLLPDAAVVLQCKELGDVVGIPLSRVPVHSVVVRLARTWMVSLETVVVGLGRAGVATEWNPSSTGLILLIGRTAGSVAARRREVKYRVDVAITPDEYSTQYLRAIHAGLPLQALGEEFATIVELVLGRGAAPVHRQMCTLLAVSSRRGPTEQRVRLGFDGAWYGFKRGPRDGRVLVWGDVKST